MPARRFIRAAVARALGALLACASPPVAADTPLAELGARAFAGDAKAMVELGLAYREGGLASVAADWFCLGATKGETDALFWCGRSLLLGFGRTVDAGAGRAMLESAVDAGSADAALLLGLHAAGAEAERRFAAAGRLGAPEGDYRLGLLLDRRGDRGGALSAYRRAAENGSVPAHNAIGIALANAGKADPEMRARALDAFIRGARLGDQAAQLNAGLELMETDPTAAERFLEQAATGRDGRIRELAEQARDRMQAARD